MLDTHVLFWWLTERARLSSTALSAISHQGVEVCVSLVSAWEMSIKIGAGKRVEATPVLNDFEKHLAAEEFRLMPISLDHVRRAGLMQSPHRDPFERLLAAQAEIEGLTLVTADARLASLGIPVLW